MSVLFLNSITHLAIWVDEAEAYSMFVAHCNDLQHAVRLREQDRLDSYLNQTKLKFHGEYILSDYARPNQNVIILRTYSSI